MTTITRREFVKTTAALTSLALAPAAEGAQESRPAVSPGDRFDYVFAGAGHNSLVCAAYLAKAGYRVLVLEGRPTIGGGVKTTELMLPGFKDDHCSTVHGGISRNPLVRNRELPLQDYGYELFDPDIVLHIPFLDGSSFTIFHEDAERTAATIARVSKQDAETFRRLVLSRQRSQAMTGEARRTSRDGVFWRRISELSGYAAARYLWESPQVQAANLLAGHFGGQPGSDPGTGLQAISMISFLDGRPIPKGGSGSLATALARFIEANHGVVATGKTVARLIVEGGRCRGVECADGSQHRGEKGVVSTIHVKHLVGMVPRALWGDALVDTVDIWQPEHAMFAFFWALSVVPAYRAADGRTITCCETAIMQRPESIFQLNADQATGELHMEDYPLQIVHPAAVDPARAPAGQASIKIEGTVPYALKEGPRQWDALKARVAERVFARYAKYTANVTKANVLASYLVSPVDMEVMNPAMWRGSVHHGLRGFDNFAPCRMPIPGLYQTGACTAPGGSVTGQPGRNTAIAILQDEGRTLEQVVGSPAKAPAR